MRTFKHSTKYTLETLVPGITLTGKHPAEVGLKFKFIGINDDREFPLVLQHPGSNLISNSHCVWDLDGKSYWEEIADKS